MGRLKWDETGKRLYETGLDHGILFVMGNNSKYKKGVPWNGLISINETPSGADANPLYADNIKYLNLIAAEDFGATIEAYTYPNEFAECDGTGTVIPGLTLGQQARKIFGLAYRTKVGNDIVGQDYGHKLHLIYGAMASPSERGYQTINDSPEAITFSWTVTTTPVDIPGFKPAAHISIDSTKNAKVNVLPSEYYTKSGVINGINFTVNDDGSVTVNGTATENANFFISRDSLVIPEGEYLYTGCPSGGSASTYRMRIADHDISVLTNDYGDGGILNITKNYINTPLRIYIQIIAGTTVENLTFRPKLTPKKNADIFKLVEDLICGKDATEGTTTEDPTDEIEPTLPSPGALMRLLNTGTPYESVYDILLDSDGNSILDDSNEDVSVRSMVIVD